MRQAAPEFCDSQIKIVHLASCNLDMEKLLHALSTLSDVAAWILFLVENVLLTCIILYAGDRILRRVGIRCIYTRREWLIGGVTNVLNTVVTYAGFWLWRHGLIIIQTGWSWRIVTDFLILFFSMDLLMVLPFNAYAIAVYLTVNLVFGLAGHLGIEPLPERWRNSWVVPYLGSSTFHHDHHRDVGYNFGFYTTVWDRVFGTLKMK